MDRTVTLLAATALAALLGLAGCLRPPPATQAAGARSARLAPAACTEFACER